MDGGALVARCEFIQRSGATAVVGPGGVEAGAAGLVGARPGQ